MTTDCNSSIPEETLERKTRRRLGIPDDAQRVLLFSESSHWDPNWLMTSEEYWDRFVRNNLDLALEALEENPRRIYSVECMFFLRMYWDRCPERQPAIRDLVNSERLRLTHSGVTTADTLLPSAEALLRDWLVGQEWLRAQGMVQEPRLAYFADSFGCSPALPSLLNAAGFDRTAITRIDGMYFVGCDYESASHFPRPGSSTEWLLEKEKAVDFYWQDANGAQVLCHWNAFNYGQGDMLAHRGISRIYIINLAFPDASEKHVARRIHQFIDQLTPCSRTPYMFCPIGFDFVPPLPGLIDMLDRYNKIRYPTTGVWVVNAGLDDYMELVECHRDKLPTLTLDPNPYWTGFYAARPTLKKCAHHLVESLLVAEKLTVQHDPVNAQQITQQLAPSWWDATVSNHHDFITGTSPDEVVEQEQMPSLLRAQEMVDGILEPYAASADTVQERDDLTPDHTSDLRPEWHHTDTGLEICTPYYVLALDAAAGGTIARAWHPETQHTLLGPGSGDLILYRGTGGTYRFGHEFAGGKFKEVERSSTRPAQLLVQERAQGIEITSTLEIGGESFERRLWLSAHSPVIQMRIVGHAPDGHTMVVGLNTGLQTDTLTMDTPGGLVERPPQRIYKPTFWPLHRFLHLCDQAQPYSLTFWQAVPGAFTYSPDGTLQAVAVRNATRERAYGVIPIPANPVTAHENSPYAFDCALWFGEGSDGPATDTIRVLQDAPVAPWVLGAWSSLATQARQIVTADLPDVEVTAVKPASRGEGLIVRLSALAPLHKTIQVRIRGHTVSQAWLCDARERDIEPISIRYGAACPKMDTTIATIRLLV